MLEGSDRFAGYHLILHHPDQKYPNDFDYQGKIEAFDNELRLRNLIIAYSQQIIDMCSTAHILCPSQNCEPCYFCTVHLPRTQAELQRCKECLLTTNARECIQLLLAHFLNVLIKSCTKHWHPGSVASTKGLEEICTLFEDGYPKSDLTFLERWTWKHVIELHMRILFGYPVSINDIIEEEVFTERPDSVKNSALLAVRSGQYENMFIYVRRDHVEESPSESGYSDEDSSEREPIERFSSERAHGIGNLLERGDSLELFSSDGENPSEDDSSEDDWHSC